MSNLKLVETLKISNEGELKKYHKQFISEGFEGSIVRTDGLYKPNGRSSNLLKYKDFQDIALELIDVEPSDSRPDQGVPIFNLNGKVFRTGMKLSHLEREDWLKNKQNYIGRVCEVRYFELSEEGVPRFGVCLGLRLDKTKGDK